MRNNFSNINTKMKIGFVIDNFEELENQLIYIMKYVPFIPQNMATISPKFISIIFESCSLIDSIFKELTNEADKKYSLKKYSKIFEDELVLDSTISLFLSSSIIFYNPYKDWKNKTPKWWNTYNRLKHDRLNNFYLGTFEITIQCVCALHQLISKTRYFTNHLIKAGWFNESGNFIPELIVTRISETGIPLGIIPCESKLFVSPLSENFVKYDNNVPLINMDDCDFSEKVKNILTIEGYF